jgi:hypothetical protein
LSGGLVKKCNKKRFHPHQLQLLLRRFHLNPLQLLPRRNIVVFAVRKTRAMPLIARNVENLFDNRLKALFVKCAHKDITSIKEGFILKL